MESLDIGTSFPDNAAFVLIHVVQRFSLDFSEVRGLRSRGWKALGWIRAGWIIADQNTGGELFEFPLRTAMHGRSRVSSAISVCDK